MAVTIQQTIIEEKREYGKLFAICREACGYSTQAELYRKMKSKGVQFSQRQLSKYENGETLPENNEIIECLGELFLDSEENLIKLVQKREYIQSLDRTKNNPWRQPYIPEGTYTDIWDNNKVKPYIMQEGISKTIYDVLDEFPEWIMSERERCKYIPTSDMLDYMQAKQLYGLNAIDFCPTLKKLTSGQRLMFMKEYDYVIGNSSRDLKIGEDDWLDIITSYCRPGDGIIPDSGYKKYKETRLLKTLFSRRANYLMEGKVLFNFLSLKKVISLLNDGRQIRFDVYVCLEQEGDREDIMNYLVYARGEESNDLVFIFEGNNKGYINLLNIGDVFDGVFFLEEMPYDFEPHDTPTECQILEARMGMPTSIFSKFKRRTIKFNQSKTMRQKRFVSYNISLGKYADEAYQVFRR